MKVYVVMGNDFPDAVFSTLEAADAHCSAKRKENEDWIASCGGLGPKIHWRVYDFEMDGGREK